MTETHPISVAGLEVDPGLIMREFTDLTMRVDETHDGLTVEALLIPYGREIEAVDLTPDGVIRYRERFLEGSNARAVKAPNRVALTFLHDEAFAARLGFGQTFREDAEGLHGRFRLYPSNAALARDVLMSSHRAISVGFVSIAPKAGEERAGELVTREHVALRHAAAVEQGQYAEAGILAIRSKSEEMEAEAKAEEDAKAKADKEAAEAAEALETVAWIDETVAEQAALRERFGLTVQDLE